MAAATLISPPASSLCRYCSSIRDVRVSEGSKTASAARLKLDTAFASGATLLMQKSFYQRSTACKSRAISIRCEQNTKDSSSGIDVWVGRLAMVSFAAAISVEIATGKGLFENIGFTTPLPPVALAGTALVGALIAFFIFQSASRK